MRRTKPTWKVKTYPIYHGTILDEQIHGHDCGECGKKFDCDCDVHLDIDPDDEQVICMPCVGREFGGANYKES
jgi:hypothetical protein